MSGYRVKIEDVPIAGGADLRIRSLLDRMQFSDAGGEALGLGIDSAQWPLFGLLWPASRLLADLLQAEDLQDMRILEIGCGLALPSLVAHRRRADVTASDRHPLTESFLHRNLRLNALPPMAYRAGNWSDLCTSGGPLGKSLGRFDMIVGSDVLYERDEHGHLPDFIDAHGQPDVRVMIVDPDRGNRSTFTRAMSELGFGVSSVRARHATGGIDDFRGQVLNYQRTPRG